jgi:hypothetical protein
MAEHQETIKGYKGAGDCEVRSLKLISTGGQVIDINPIVVEMSFYSNLFSHYLECDVVINDSLGLISSLANGFTGGEILVVSFKTNSEDMDYVTHAFGLYELGDRMRVEEKNESYRISGISLEYYSNTAKKISRGYGGQSGNQISNMVQSILDEHFNSPSLQALYRDIKEKSGVRVEKTNTVDPTNGLQRLCIPNLSVDDTLDLMGSEADCDGHVPMYIFYENKDGYQFRDVNSLIMEELPEDAPVYTYEPSNANDPNETSADSDFKDPLKIESFRVVRENNFIENAKSGMFASETLNIDILRKNYRRVKYDYNENVNKFQRLNSVTTRGSIEGQGDIMVTTSRIGHDSDPLFANERVLPKRRNQFLALKRGFFKHNFNTKVEFVLPGDSDLSVGQKIKISIPAATNLDEQDGQEDKYLSGTYIITNCRQKMSGNGDDYRTIIQCAKDSGT